MADFPRYDPLRNQPLFDVAFAQVLLRAGDPRYFDLMTAWQSSPRPRGNGRRRSIPAPAADAWGTGSMSGPRRNGLDDTKLFCARRRQPADFMFGNSAVWLEKNQTIAFGPAPTLFGDIKISITPQGQNILVEWRGLWSAQEPR